MTVTVGLWNQYAHDTYEERGTMRRLCDDSAAPPATLRDEVPEGYTPCVQCEFLREQGPALFTDDSYTRIDTCIETFKSEQDPAKLAEVLWLALRGYENWRHRRKAIVLLIDRCHVEKLSGAMNIANFEVRKNPEFEPYVHAIHAGRNALPKVPL